MSMHECDHGLGPITGTSHYLIVTYDRPWWRLFRKRRYIRCFRCDLKISE